MQADRDDARLFGLLESLDEPTPDVDVEELIARGTRRRPPGAMRWAAGLLLTFGAAGAAYAAPGSPVRGWIDGLVGGGAVVSEPHDVAPALDDLSGIVVVPPESSELVVELPSQSEGTISVSLTDSDGVSVAALNGAAVFDSRAQRLVVQASEVLDYRVEIPRTARVTILVGSRTIFTLVAGDVTTDGVAADGGRYLVDLSQLR